MKKYKIAVAGTGYVGLSIILTKNEEKNLRKCVESFRGVAKRFVIV